MPGYLKIIRSIVAAYFNMKNLDPRKTSLLRENSNKNSRDFLILNIFMEKIDAFCQVASDSIFFGNLIVLKTIVKAGEEFKETIKNQRDALLDTLRAEKEFAIMMQDAKEVLQICLLNPVTPLASSPWEISKRISPESPPHLIEREVNVRDDSEIVNPETIESIKIDHLNSRDEITDTDQARFQTTTSCPKQCSEAFTTTPQIKA